MKNSKFIRKTEQMRKSFFLFGLVLALGAAHSALSYRLVESFESPDQPVGITLNDDVVVPITIRKTEPIPERRKETKKVIKKANTTLFIAIDDLTFIDEGNLEPAIDEVYSQHEDEVKEVFFHSLDRKPIYNGCESLSTEDERFDCFQEKLRDHVSDNFKANKMGWGNTEKMMVRFEIDQEGMVSDVKIARGEELDKKQLEEIIKNLPQFTPGMFNGKYVKTSYVLPVVVRN